MADRMPPATPPFLAGGGAIGALIRAHDWSSTELGPPQLWPVPLRTSIRVLLTTNHPVFLFWGPNHLCFYNDAYSASLGPEKHPSMLGAAGRDAWDEIWDVIGPQIDHVMAGRGATWHEDHLIPIIRHGRLEDVYWTYSYSPIDYDSAPNGVGGVLVPCTETTGKVLAAERMKAAEARWRGLFAQTPGFMCMLSGPRHVIDYANPQYVQLVGRDDIVGKSVGEALPWAIEQGFVQLLDRVYASGEAYAGHGSRVALPRPDGSTDLRYLDFAYQPVRDERGTVTGIFVLGTDVTERKAAEAALAQSEERLRLARDAAGLGIHDYDITSGAVQWDARTRALWGVEPDEPITYAYSWPACTRRIGRERRRRWIARWRRAGTTCTVQCTAWSIARMEKPGGCRRQDRSLSTTGARCVWWAPCRTSPNRSRMKRRCATSIGARTSSWPRWRTSCAIRWPRCATPWR